MTKFSFIKNSALLGLCLLKYIVSGKANKIFSYPRAVLVIRWKNNVGDIVYITPLFSAIKKQYPECKVYLLGNKRAEEVTKHNPNIDKFIDFDGSIIQAIKNIRPFNVDFACVANAGSTPGFAIPYLAGVKGISLFDKKNEPRIKSWSYNILKKLGLTVPLFSGEYIPGQYTGLLKPIGANTENIHFRLYFSKEAENKINNIFAQNNIKSDSDFVVAFAPGGAVEERWWPAERFARLAEFLYREHNARILIIGAGKDEKAISAMIDAIDKNIPRVNLLNQNLDEFKATISKCDLVIGNDSGSMVTADAFDVANLVFVGPTDEKEYHLPPGPKNRVLRGKDGDVKQIFVEEAKKELHIILDNFQHK